MRFERTQHDVYREFRAVLAPGIEFKTRTHGTEVRIAMIGMTLADMPGPEPLRNEHFHRLPQKLITTVTEQLFRLLVNTTNLAVGIRKNDPIGQRLVETLQQTALFLSGFSYIHPSENYHWKAGCARFGGTIN